MQIGIVDYGVGNIRSILNALERLEINRVKVSSNGDELASTDGIILPGVGAFATCMSKLRENDLNHHLTEMVCDDGKPILGICVGMQLLVDSSMEDGFHEGLAWISGDIKKLTPKNNLSIPHVGWNDIYNKSSSPIFFGIHDEHHFFFDHSYHYVGDKKFVSATCDYGGNINVAIEHKNIFGVQFHPEKSSTGGLKVFRNFTNWIKNC